MLSAADAAGPEGAEAAGKTLLASGGVELIFGTGNSTAAYPGSDAAELAQLPYLELTAPADGITARNFKFLLRFCPTATMLVQAAFSGLGARFSGKKTGLLFNTGATAGAVAAAVLAQGQAGKLPPPFAIGYPEDAADLHEPVGRMMRAGIEVVWHAAGPDDVLAFFQAMQDLGWRPGAVVGFGAGYGLRETAFTLGPVFDGVYLCAAPFFPPAATAVAQAYEDRFGMSPRSAESLSAYVGAKLALEVLAREQGDAGKLLAALRQTRLATGSLANGWGIAFDKTGQNLNAFATVQQWRAGALVPVG